MKEFEKDVFRKTGKFGGWHKYLILFLNRDLKCLKVYRKANYLYKKSQKTKSILTKMRYFLAAFKLIHYSNKYDFNIPASTSIGDGLFIGHNGPITINPNAIIGKNCNIGIGVTVGQENRGNRKGCPIIGDKVWIGTNAVIVGKIKIGSRVLIAPNAYVNFDVPDDSIVIGNPAKVIHRLNAVDGYVNNVVD